MFRKGITLVELVVVTIITGIVVSLLLVGVLSVRESARKVSCANNMRQIGLALQNYSVSNHAFPYGSGGGYSFHVRLLPFLEQENKYNQINFSERAEDQLDRSWAKVPIVLTCPTDPFTNTDDHFFATNYVGVSGGGPNGYYNGILVSNTESGRQIGLHEVTDGLSNTIAVTETMAYRQYTDGSNHSPWKAATFNTSRSYEMPSELAGFSRECFSLDRFSNRPSTYSLGSFWTDGSIGITRIVNIFVQQPHNCANGTRLGEALHAPNSLHSNGIYAVFGDGHTALLSTTLEDEVWRAYGSRNGGEVVGHPN